MAQVRCPYCHEYIDEASVPAHEAGHRKTRPDGQQTDYATLPEDEQAQGDLAGVPKVYVHRKCGVARTGMGTAVSGGGIGIFYKHRRAYRSSRGY